MAITITVRIDFESNLVSKFASSKDPSIYKYIKSVVKCSGLPAALTYKSTTVTSEIDKASVFNDFSTQFFLRTLVAFLRLIFLSQLNHFLLSHFPRKISVWFSPPLNQIRLWVVTASIPLSINSVQSHL